jgi:dipeptidyl aminopeptidase/acylaminoacyl peptidase
VATLRRLVLLIAALLAIPVCAEAGTLRSVPVAGGRVVRVGGEAGAFFGTPCWRADGGLIARVERRRAAPRYGLFRTGAAPRWRAVDDDVLDAVFGPGCALVAEVYYAFGDDPESDGGVLVRTAAGKEVMRVQSNGYPDGPSLAWSRDGRRLAVAMSERRHGTTIRVLDVRSGRVLARRKADTYLTAQAFAPDGRSLVYVEEEVTRILAVATGRVRTLAGGSDEKRLREPVWSPKGDRIAAIDEEGGIQLLAPADGYGPRIPASAVWTETLAWSPDGATLALQFKRPNEREAIDRYGLALVAATPTGRLRRLVQPLASLSSPVWSPDGSALAVAAQ